MAVTQNNPKHYDGVSPAGHNPFGINSHRVGRALVRMSVFLYSRRREWLLSAKGGSTCPGVYNCPKGRLGSGRSEW